MVGSDDSLLKSIIRFFGSIVLSTIWYEILLFIQSYIPWLSGIGFSSLLILGILLLFLIVAHFDSIHTELVYGVWIFASIFLSWIWYGVLLLLQSYIPDLVFYPLLIFGALIILYSLKKMFGIEFNLSRDCRITP